jgi:large subunit ribosomal protein L17
MRNHNTNRKFGRQTNQRRALLRSLAISLINTEKMETTEAKAREIRSYVEKLITKGKKGDLAARRNLNSKLGSGGDSASKKIIEVLAPLYKDRNGGYLRIIKKGKRIGSDGADMALIEFVK